MDNLLVYEKFFANVFFLFLVVRSDGVISDYYRHTVNKKSSEKIYNFLVLLKTIFSILLQLAKSVASCVVVALKAKAFASKGTFAFPLLPLQHIENFPFHQSSKGSKRFVLYRSFLSKNIYVKCVLHSEKFSNILAP